MGLFGTNGVRGVLGVNLSLEDIHKITMSVAAHVRSGPVLVGRDGRDTSAPISSTILSSLCYAGISCADAGLIPTPCLALTVRDLGYSCGIMATASHNPPEYGGLKVIWGDGIEAARRDELAIEAIHTSKSWKGAIRGAPWPAPSVETRAPTTYCEKILNSVDAQAISESELGIVIDIGNGAQATTAPSIARSLCDGVELIHADIDPEFGGRGPEPGPENLSALSDAVRATGADVGIAFDGDGDRSIICDERGKVLSGDTSALFLVSHILDSKPDSDIVTPINSGDAIDEVAAAAGARVVRTRVGSVTVSRTMAEIGALAGFEENGGFMYGPHLPVRDGAMTMALALDAISSSRTSLSHMVGLLPKSFTSKARVKCAPGQAVRAIKALADDHPDAQMLDGVKIRLGPHKWVMARPSGTEPIIRIYAESDSASSLESLLTEYTEEVRRHL